MKKTIQKVFIVVWVLLLTSLGYYYVFEAPRESAYSETENRQLAGLPDASARDVFSGKFGTEIEQYFLDRFPIRNFAISNTNKLENVLSFATYEDYLLIADGPDDPLDNDDYVSDLEDLIGDLESDNNDQTYGEPSLPSGPTDSPAHENTENPPIEKKPEMSAGDFKESLGVYMDRNGNKSATNTYSRNNVMAVTAVLNKYAKLLPENGKLMFTVVPQSTYANRFVNATQKTAYYSEWDDVVNGLGSDNVYAFDAAEILSEAIKKNEYVYFRTDMHWTPYGSYLLYCEMAKRAGQKPCSYFDFKLTAESPFRGTYYRDNPAAYMDVEPDVLDLLMPTFPLEWRRTISKDNYKLIDFLDFNAKANDRYTVYLGGPAGPWTYAQCDNGKSENCLVLTDSFGLGFVPFLTANYKQVHYYDPRYFDSDIVGYTVAEMIEKNEIQDIYVVVGDLHSFDSSFLISLANKQLGV